MRSDRTLSNQSPRLFADIDSHWARDCIADLARQNLVRGDQNGRFRPDATMTRSEFAALMYWVFPKSLPVREPQPFDDVPIAHWANKVVRWVTERGFFSGYDDRTFRPDRPVSRSQAFVVLINGLNYVLPLFPQIILDEYFDDASGIPVYAKSAIATATLSSLVVNYPDVRKLRPNQPITRGEVAALLCQVFQPSPTVPRQHVTWSLQLEAITESIAVPFELLRANARLVKQLQTHFKTLKLYPDTAAIDGRYSSRVESALIEFCQILELPNRHRRIFDRSLAQQLLTVEPVCLQLARAKDRQKIFSHYLQQEQGFNAAALAFLDKGIYGSPYEAEIKNYPINLLQKPVEFTTAAVKSASAFPAFPKRGALPLINAELTFLHADIQQACLCLGRFSQGQLTARWLGRNALANVELWSATKIIPLLNVISQANASLIKADIDDQWVRAGRGSREFRFYDLALDIVNYKSNIGSSNSLAAMFKQFETPQNLENWLKAITGNTDLVFRGRYGEGAFMQAPQLWNPRLQKVVLAALPTPHRGNNSVSTYDLTRLITMLAWHPFLPSDAQLPGAQWHSLESMIRAMGADSARYIDVAIEQLGLKESIAAPVIISKLGFGRSGIRHRTELVYSAFVQFLDQHSCASAESPEVRSIGMTLIAAKKLGDGDREAVELDARMAAEVTEILRRLVTDEL
jgi:hypothetical protein